MKTSRFLILVLLFILHSALCTLHCLAGGGVVISPGNGSGGGGATTVPLGQTVYVSKTGSDGTGARARGDLPFLTLTAAKAAASSGDTIVVYPGLYANEVNLAKDGVTWQFMGPGCILSNFALNATGNTNAFFADSGSVTNFAVFGNPTLIYNTGTNVFNLDTNLDVPQDIGATNALYAIKITNANTTATFEVDRVSLTTYFGAAASPVAIYIANCSNVTVNVRQVDQPNTGQTFTYTSGTLGAVNFSAASTAFFWGLGDVYFNFGQILKFDQYGIWCVEPSGVHTNNLWWKGSEMKTKIYVDSHSQTYRTWGNIGWLNCSNSVAGYAADYFGGFNYLTAQKISDSVVAAVQVTTGGTLWLDAQKISSPTIWMHVTAVATNRLSAIVHEFEDLGSVTNGIDIEGGTNFISGQQARTINGSSVYFHPTATSKTKIFGLNIDTSAGSGTNKWPVIANGAGLHLQNCNLISPANVFTIFSSSAQNVGILGGVMASTNKHGNVTLQPLGTFTVDSNLQ